MNGVHQIAENGENEGELLAAAKTGNLEEVKRLLGGRFFGGNLGQKLKFRKTNFVKKPSEDSAKPLLPTNQKNH